MKTFGKDEKVRLTIYVPKAFHKRLKVYCASVTPTVNMTQFFIDCMRTRIENFEKKNNIKVDNDCQQEKEGVFL